MSDVVLFDVEDDVAVLTFNRPDRLNAWTPELQRRYFDLLDECAEREDVRVIILTGAGRGFCAGQDLNDRAAAPGESVDLGESVLTCWNPLIRTLTSLPQPVIARVNGVAAGAGANIALAADIVIAARSAKFIQSFANIGLVPDSGGTWILPRLAGQARALGLALTGEALSAEKAEAWGLIWRVVDDAQLQEETAKLAVKFAGGPTMGLAAIKETIRGAWKNDLSTQLDIERDFQRALGRTSDYKEGVAAFGEKRPPKFTGH